MQEIPLSPSKSAERYYFESLTQGQFLIPQCQACQRHHFFPRVLCPHCGEDRLQWVKPSGHGVVYSTTTVRRSTGDYTVCLIDLDEGPRMMSRVVDMEPEKVRIGLAVKARIDMVDDAPLLVFVARQEASA